MVVVVAVVVVGVVVLMVVEVVVAELRYICFRHMKVNMI